MPPKLIQKVELNQPQVEELIAVMISLDREIAYKQEQLDAKKVRLKDIAQIDRDNQVPNEAGGWSWSCGDGNGNLARVTQPAPALKSKIDGEGEQIEKVRALAGKFFAKLFSPVLNYRPVSGFRDEVHLLLPGREALKLTKLVSGASSLRVAFETKTEGAK